MTDTERAEYNDVVRKLTTKLEEAVGEVDRLRNVVAKLTGTDDAHSTLRRLYLDETQPPNTRLKAAQASINFEKSRLESVPPAIDATCEEIEPLSVVVERQRKRADAIMALPLAERERMISGVVKRDGNGDSSSND